MLDERDDLGRRLADWVPTGVGSGVYFLALFTFDNAGQPLWLTMQIPLTDREFSTSAPLQKRCSYS